MFKNLIKILAILLIIMNTGACKKVISTEVYISVDTSGSTDDERKHYFGILDGIIDALPQRTKVFLYSFDKEVRELYSGCPVDSESLWNVQDTDLQANKREGSHVDKMLSVINKNLESTSAERIAIVLIWDGENTGKDIKPLLKKISEDNRVDVVFIAGVDSSLRASVRDNFNQCSHKLILCGMNDIGEGVNEFKKFLRNKKVAVNN